MPEATCPECREEIQIDADADIMDIVHCEECGEQFEIVGLDPVQLDTPEDEDYLFDEEEDEDDDDFEY